MLLVLLIALSTLSASDLIWSWKCDDVETKYFRYQLGGEEKWNVIDSSIASIALPSKPGINTLYVAASRDGVVWSEPAVGEYVAESRSLELSLKLSPYALERITYTIEHSPENRLSAYGLGAGAGFAYDFYSVFGIESNLSIEYYSFKGFHRYFDFKGDIRARLRVLDIGINRLYMGIGGGVDFVARDDGSCGMYPLLSYGIRDRILLSDCLALGICFDFNHTFQNGSNVFGFISSVSFSYLFGSEGGRR